MAINWSTVPLIGCLLTVLIEWQVAARLKIIFLGEQLLSFFVHTVAYRNEVGGCLRGCLKLAQIVKFSTLEGPWSLFQQTFFKQF